MTPVVQRRRVTFIALSIGVLIALVFVLAQALLPSLAARRVSDRVARYGTVSSVHVSAFPAIELLWGHADSVTVTAATLTITPSQVASLLWEAHGVARMTVSAGAANLRVAGLTTPLSVSDVRMHKQGSAIQASATLTQQQLDSALPNGFHIEPISSEAGQVQARASGGLFGVRASLGVLVKPLSGQLVAEPTGLPFSGLATVRLFSDPHLFIGSVGLRVLRSQPLTYGLSFSASLA
jgi:LmeA-like phospholipid-binding